MTRMDGCWLTRMDGRRRVGSRRPGGGGLFWLTRMNECWLTRMDGRRRAGSRRWWSTAASTSPSARRRGPAPLRQRLSTPPPPTPPRPANPAPPLFFLASAGPSAKRGAAPLPLPSNAQHAPPPPPPPRSPPSDAQRTCKTPPAPRNPAALHSLQVSVSPQEYPRLRNTTDYPPPPLPLRRLPPTLPSFSSPPSSLHKKRHGSGAGVGGCG